MIGCRTHAGALLSCSLYHLHNNCFEFSSAWLLQTPLGFVSFCPADAVHRLLLLWKADN
jgi:hypothetical protein